MSAAGFIGLEPSLNATEADERTETKAAVPYAIVSLFALFNMGVIQGFVIGLTCVSIPLLLRENGFTSTQIMYASSANTLVWLKVFFAPVIESYYIQSIGKRKTWIILPLLSLGLLFLLSNFHINDLVTHNDRTWALAYLLFTMASLASTSDIAINAWALTIAQKEDLYRVVVAKMTGFSIGTLFSLVGMALTSTPMCHSFLYRCPYDNPPLDAKDLFVLAGCYIAVNGLLFCFEQEYVPLSERNPIMRPFDHVFEMLQLPAVKELISVLLLARCSFAIMEASIEVNMMKKGFNDEFIPILTAADIFLQVIFSFWAVLMIAKHKWNFNSWFFGFVITGSAQCMSFIFLYHTKAVNILSVASLQFYLQLCVSHIATILGNTIMNLSMATFLARITDLNYAASYLAVLQAISTFGARAPRFLATKAMAYFSSGSCDGVSGFPCKENHECFQHGFRPPICYQADDGFVTVFASGMIIGLILLVPTVRRMLSLQSHPERDWKLTRGIASR